MDMIGGSSPHPGVRAFMLKYFSDGEVDFVPTEVREDIQSAVSVSHATVSRWVTGKSTVKQKHWKALAQAAGTTAEVLRGYIEAEPASQPPSRVAALEDEVRRLRQAVLRLAGADRPSRCEVACRR